MLASVGVLLLLAGISVFLIGLVKLIFPSTESFLPDGFKQFISFQYGVYIFLAGLLLVRFF